MADVREDFYRQNITQFFKDKSVSILVCGAGMFDKQVFEAAGFTNVTISNLDTRMDANQYAPYHWAFEDAASLSYADNSFDYVAIHAAIHHASSPHKVVTEMYRVAKKGMLAIESRDSFVSRMFERFGLVETFEQSAVFYNDCKFGGVNNTDIPNYVYRWTEREVEKTVLTYAPYARHRFEYRYATSFPASPGLEKGGSLKHLLLKVFQPLYRLFTLIFPRQKNLFAFYVAKPRIPDDVHEWIAVSDDKLSFNKEWGRRKYKGDVVLSR